jgi:hypothetical protein
MGMGNCLLSKKLVIKEALNYCCVKFKLTDKVALILFLNRP